MKILRFTLFLPILLLIIGFTAVSQPTLQNDYSYSLKIPSVQAMASSAAHLYVVSQAEGVAVFRTHPDSLQWLYTASGMQRRGHTIRADIRFAYLFGDSKRLTVLEPTSVLGAYSATRLPRKPLDVARFRDNLYVALGSDGVGRLNLKTPDALDSPVQPVNTEKLKDQSVLNLAASSDKLFFLSDEAQVFVFNKSGNAVTFSNTISLNKSLDHIFYVNDTLMGTSSNGSVYEISDDGSLAKLGSIGEPVTNITGWKNWLIIRGKSNRLWSSRAFGEPTLWKKNKDAGNYVAVSKNQLWLSEYDQISRVRVVSKSAKIEDQPANSSAGADGKLKIQPIKNQVVPYPHDLLLPLKLESGQPVQNVHFSLQTDATKAKIRGQSLYWKPTSNDTGEHRFKIIASLPGGQSSSTQFTVDVQRFNSPPRFTPLRTISIPVDRPFSLPIRALDPDGTDKNLVRYLGVNLPQGASLDEQTGAFKWTPTERQLGKNTFRVIATDQYGAASSADVTIKVIKTNGGEN